VTVPWTIIVEHYSGEVVSRVVYARQGSSQAWLDGLRIVDEEYKTSKLVAMVKGGPFEVACNEGESVV